MFHFLRVRREKREKKALREALTLPKFTAWLEKQDPTEPYWYPTPRGCAAARYLQEQGFEDVHVFPTMVTLGFRYDHSEERSRVPFPPVLQYVVSAGYDPLCESFAEKESAWTYGKALARAKEFA